VLVEGQVVGTTELRAEHPGAFFDVEYPLPAALTAGKTKVTVRFQPKPGRLAGGVFGVAMLKPEAAAK
jgi:hypothetical protein